MTNKFEMTVQTKKGDITYKLTGEESYIKSMSEEIFDRHDIKSEEYRVDDRYADSLKRFYAKDEEKKNLNLTLCHGLKNMRKKQVST